MIFVGFFSGFSP